MRTSKARVGTVQRATARGMGAAVVLCLVATPASVAAFDRTGEATILEIDQTAKELRDTTHNRKGPLENVNRFTLKRDEAVAIRLANHNPFLFSYETATAKEDTEQYEEALKLAEALKGVIKAFGLGEFVNASRGGDRTIDGFDFARFSRVLGDINAASSPGNLGSLVDRLRLDSASAASARAEISKWTIDSWRKDLGEAVAAATKVAAKCAGGQQVEIVDQGVARLAGCRSPIHADAGAPAIIEYVTLVLAVRAELERSIDLLRDVALAAEAMARPKDLGTWSYSIQRQTITVTVKENTRFDSILSGAAKKARKEGTASVVVVLEPYQPALISVGPAAVLGFLKDPEFTVVKDGDAYRIQETDEDATTYRVAAMMNITPRRWAEPTFGGAFQLGVSPQKDATAFYVGAAIRAQTVLSFGGGFVWQQVKELAPGLSVDKPIESPDQLKTQTKFKPGFYLHITATIP